jgi:RND family efflux transporter MFP subunit
MQDQKPKPGLLRKLVRVLLMYLLPLVVLTIAGFGAVRLVKTGPKAQQRPPEQSSILVQVQTVGHTDASVMVHAMGTVIAAQEVILQPRVSGEIVKISPAFIPGEHFKAKEVILQIDPEDYELALEQSRSQVAQSRYAVKLELGYQDIAQHEWELLGVKDASESERELALRKPHLEKANASLSAAQAAEQKAKLDLERTRIVAPFNGIITMKNVDVGAQVTPQTELARMVGTDEYWIQVSIPVDQLKWITFPKAGNERGSVVRIYLRNGVEGVNHWTGYVLRLLGDLEPQGRMARILVTVHDPLGLDVPEGKKRSPLLIGSFVNVVIEGVKVRNIIAMPRAVLRDGSNIWIMNKSDELEIRKVEIVWGGPNRVFIRDGIQDGERIVVSDLATPVSGTRLRVESSQDQRFSAEQQR